MTNTLINQDGFDTKIEFKHKNNDFLIVASCINGVCRGDIYRKETNIKYIDYDTPLHYGINFRHINQSKTIKTENDLKDASIKWMGI